MTFSRERVATSCSTFVLLNFSSVQSLSFSFFFARIHDLDANESGQYSVSAPRWHASRTERYKRFFRFALFFARTIFQASFLPNCSFVKYFTYRFTDLSSKIRCPVSKSLPSTLERWNETVNATIERWWFEEKGANTRTWSNYNRQSPILRLVVSSLLIRLLQTSHELLHVLTYSRCKLDCRAQWETKSMRYEFRDAVS